MTADAHFLITPHPTLSNLYIATGGSRYGFKFLPTIGRYIADMLQEILREEFREK